MELRVETDGTISFVLPTVLNPRYTPADHPCRQGRSAEVTGRVSSRECVVGLKCTKTLVVVIDCYIPDYTRLVWGEENSLKHLECIHFLFFYYLH